MSVSPVDFRSVSDAIERVAPHEIYNLSGQSSVALSFSQPAETLSSVTQATINFLEALRLKKSNIRFYNAGSSEIFGDTEGHAANEGTAYHPKALTASLKQLPFVLLPITGMPTGFSPVQDFYSTMSLLSGRTTL